MAPQHLDSELKLLKDNVLELMFLVKNQLEKGQKALDDFDEELAHEIMANEKRVDSLELTIDRDCENLLALYNPVAVDLRFVMAAFKINSDLERIGDHANSIAKYIADFGRKIDEDTLETMRLDKMYNTANEMVSNVFNAFITEDTDLARKVFRLDKTLNKINREVSGATAELIEADISQTQNYLYLFSIIRKLERVGDLTKNIAEELIFYIEAKVLKHKKMKSKNNNGNDK
ncbi:phosphate transport system regulatory protein PhoU [Aliifodinibius salipaludis]|uniref:Phosphate-specific transport system accessory protein PhoU n=1 Tax=Fodinibius salipaludis TaxID=2032627 RepID=A0A2A2GFQ5_9BACT|nr:phosphate signaling complex protein PhoU [Aliifodinibius salipaludis]PAU95602.1 phosphate transport system regulatory protein PhoU [Aliifodinibius salipaludis]